MTKIEGQSKAINNPVLMYNCAYQSYKLFLEVSQNPELSKETIIKFGNFRLLTINQALYFLFKHFDKYLNGEERHCINKKRLNFINKYKEVVSFRNNIIESIQKLESVTQIN